MGCAASVPVRAAPEAATNAGSPPAQLPQSHTAQVQPIAPNTVDAKPVNAEHSDDAHHGEADESMWEGILTRMRPTMLKGGEVRSALVLGAGVSGLQCAVLLQQKGVSVTILEARDRIGGRLHTDENGLDIGGHWIHGGGPDEHVAAYSKDAIGPAQLNPVRALCDDLGIETKLTDGDSCYIGSVPKHHRARMLACALLRLVLRRLWRALCVPANLQASRRRVCARLPSTTRTAR